MLKLCRVTKVKVLFLVLAYAFNFNLFEFLAAILEKGLLLCPCNHNRLKQHNQPIRIQCKLCNQHQVQENKCDQNIHDWFWFGLLLVVKVANITNQSLVQ